MTKQETIQVLQTIEDRAVDFPYMTACDWVAIAAAKRHLENSIEVKEVDLELITGWFDHIAQIADDRMTLTGQRMTDAHALDEIKCLAKNSSEFITRHYKAQKIKERISKTQDGLMDDNGNFEYQEHEGAYNILCNLDAYIDSLQEEPVSGLIDFEQELYKAFGQVKDFTLGMRIAKRFYDMGSKAGAKWQKEQFEKNRLAACDKQTEEEEYISWNSMSEKEKAEFFKSNPFKIKNYE